jgi:hypothetical protein
MKKDIMEPGDPTSFIDTSFSQLDVGRLEIRTHAFSIGENIYYAYEIRILDASGDEKGWGKEIFSGSLKELINIVKEAQNARTGTVKVNS